MANGLNARVAAEIVRCLRQQGLTQSDLCASVGWTDAFLSRRIVGRVSFSLDEIETIASALDVPRSQILNAPLPAASDRLAG